MMQKTFSHHCLHYIYTQNYKLKNGLGRKLTLNLMKLRNNKRNIISAVCSLWPKSGTAKCITSRPTFKSGTARAVPLTYVPTPLLVTPETVSRGANLA